MNQKIIYKLISLATTAFFIALFIFLLPSILIALAALIVFLVISSVVVAFLIRKNIIKTNFTYARSTYNQQKHDANQEKEMIDVTNSNKD